MSCGKPCGCPTYREHLLSVGVAPSATPSRGGGARAAEIGATERQWDRDFPAYKRLRAEGLQPRRSDGCAELEQRATDRHQIEGTPAWS